MVEKPSLEEMGERLDFLMAWEPKSAEFKKALPGGIDRLCQKISESERVQNE